MNYYEFLKSQLHPDLSFFRHHHANTKFLKFHCLFIEATATRPFSFSVVFNSTLLLTQKQHELDWRPLLGLAEKGEKLVWSWLKRARLSRNFPAIWMKELCDSLAWLLCRQNCRWKEKTGERKMFLVWWWWLDTTRRKITGGKKAGRGKALRTFSTSPRPCLRIINFSCWIEIFTSMSPPLYQQQHTSFIISKFIVCSRKWNFLRANRREVEDEEDACLPIPF